MLIPVRCFTCGALVADKYQDFLRRTQEGEDPGHVLDTLGLKRYCCRRMLLSNVDTLDQITPYFEALARRHEEFESEHM